jgi:general secretion pathway protein M
MALAPASLRRERMLAFGITLLAVALAWFAVAAPVRGWYVERAEQLEGRRMLVQRMAVIATTLPALRRQAEAGSGGGPAPSDLLAGDTDAIAGAALQEQIQAMAARAGANLSSAETLPAAQAGAFRRIGLRISLSASWPMLVRLLESIEQATPRMLVDDLQVHGPRIALRQVAEPPLNAELTVFGFRGPAGPDGRPEPGQ